MARNQLQLNDITLGRVDLDAEHLVEKLSAHEATALVDAILSMHGAEVFKNAAESVIGEFHDAEAE